MMVTESVIKNIANYLKSKGILKTEWRGRVLYKGAQSLSQMIGPMSAFKDDEMLEILKILKKKKGDDIFQYAGFTNTDYGTDEYTFLDLAITNKNFKSLSWLIDNVSELYLADANTLIKRRSKELLGSGWFKKRGLELIEYLDHAIELDNHKKSSTTDAIRNLFSTAIEAAYDSGSWITLNQIIPGILTTKNRKIKSLLLSSIQHKSFLTLDDVEFVKWIIKNESLKWKNYKILGEAVNNGEIQKYLKKQPNVMEIVLKFHEDLSLDLEYWLDEETQEAFLF